VSISSSETPVEVTPESVSTQPFKFNLKRLLTASLAFVCGILAAVSALSAWWTWSNDGMFHTSGTVHFLPGGSSFGTLYGYSGSQSYAAADLGPVGALYEGVLAGVLTVTVLSFVVGIVALLASLGKVRDPARHTTVRNALIVSLVVILSLVILVPALQPGLFNGSDPADCYHLGTGTTPCNSFWGSASGAGGTSSWGADSGWYLGVTTVVLLIAALILWRLSAYDPWEQATPTLTPSGAPAPAPVISTSSPRGRVCPQCGAYYSAPVPEFCWKCGGPVGAVAFPPFS